jgi:hypothetical protein
MWLCFCLATKAQQISSITGNLFSNHQLIEDAVTDGLFIVRSCYLLQDTTVKEPTYYRWRDLPYFGDSCSLGVKLKKGYCIGDIAANPWKYDTKYEEYRSRNRYKPVMSESYYRQINDSLPLLLSLEKKEIKSISTNHIYLVEDTLFQNKGFEINNSNGEKKGWIVWVISDKPLPEQKDMKISFSIYRTELLFEHGKEIYNIEMKNPPVNKTVLGGIYILPKYPEIGEIVFQLGGYLHKENNQWQVIRYTKYVEILSSSENEDKSISNETENLTPVDKKTGTEIEKNKRQKR